MPIAESLTLFNEYTINAITKMLQTQNAARMAHMFFLESSLCVLCKDNGAMISAKCVVLFLLKMFTCKTPRTIGQKKQ